MAHHWEGIKPDIVAVGKALSCGMMTISSAFINYKVMMCIKPTDLLRPKPNILKGSLDEFQFHNRSLKQRQVDFIR